jgi:hypothetical protein
MQAAVRASIIMLRACSTLLTGGRSAGSLDQHLQQSTAGSVLNQLWINETHWWLSQQHVWLLDDRLGHWTSTCRETSGKVRAFLQQLFLYNMLAFYQTWQQ